MSPFEIEEAFNNVRFLVDTREQRNNRLNNRLNQIIESGGEIERCKLDFGDYSIAYSIPSINKTIDLSSNIVIERKKDLDELAMCFSRDRDRFRREFERAKESNCKVFLLIENASWNPLYSDLGYKTLCRSQLPRKSVIGSLRAWQMKYGFYIEFCQSDITGYLIRDILLKYMREVLDNDE